MVAGRGPGGRLRAGRRPPRYTAVVNLTIEFDREADGRWIAEVMEIPGALAYGTTRENAAASAQAIALRTLADRIDLGGLGKPPLSLEFSTT